MVSSAVRRFLVVCAVIAFVEPLAAQGVQAPPLTVHAIWGSREYASDLVDITWMKDGKAYTAIEQDASGNTDFPGTARSCSCSQTRPVSGGRTPRAPSTCGSWRGGASCR